MSVQSDLSGTAALILRDRPLLNTFSITASVCCLSYRSLTAQEPPITRDITTNPIQNSEVTGRCNILVPLPVAIPDYNFPNPYSSNIHPLYTSVNPLRNSAMLFTESGAAL